MMSRFSQDQLSAHVDRSGQKAARSASDMIASNFIFCLAFMRLISILNRFHHFPGFVNVAARLCAERNSIEVEVRSRKGSRGICSCCEKPGPTYDHLKVRRFEFVPLWGLAVLLLYCMRRIDCRTCGVKVEQVPWGNGK